MPCATRAALATVVPSVLWAPAWTVGRHVCTSFESWVGWCLAIHEHFEADEDDADAVDHQDAVQSIVTNHQGRPGLIVTRGSESMQVEPNQWGVGFS
jgi:hypothetical protein